MTIRIPFTTTTAIVAVVAMLVVAIGAGGLAAVVARPSPTPSPSAAPVATATAQADTGPLVFEQPLSAGCASRDAVWVFSDGGGIGRFDGTRWELIDDTLRTLVSAACTATVVYAVGPSGRIVTVDDRSKTIRADDIGLFDAYGIGLLPDGALVAGSGGNVYRQSSAGWQPYADGIPEDLFSVVGFSGSSAWAVGSQGASYRLDSAGWRPFPTGTSETLRTIAGGSPTDAVAAGDRGVLLRFDGHWVALASGVDSELRASARAGSVTYVVGDNGVAIAVDGAKVTRVDLGTTCTLRGVFTRANEVWFVGSEGTHAGVWRQSGGAIAKWGTC